MKDIPFGSDHIPGLIGKAALSLPDCCDEAVTLSQAVIQDGYAFCSQECASYSALFLQQSAKLELAQARLLTEIGKGLDWFPSFATERRTYKISCERCFCKDRNITYYCNKGMIDKGYRFRDGVCALCAEILIANDAVQTRWSDSLPFEGWEPVDCTDLIPQRCIHQGQRCCGMMWEDTDEYKLYAAFISPEDLEVCELRTPTLGLWCASCMEDRDLQERLQWWNGGGVCAQVKKALMPSTKDGSLISPLFDIVEVYLISSYSKEGIGTEL